jgi:hypothetical protein
LEAFAESFSLLFVVFAVSCIALGIDWETNFAGFFGVRAHLHRLGKRFEIDVCCYVQFSCEFASPWQAERRLFPVPICVEAIWR